VDHETFPWCNAYEEAHDQGTCLYSKDIIMQVRVGNDELSGVDTACFLGEGICVINNVMAKTYIVSEDQMKKIKGRRIELAAVARVFAKKPAQEEIRKRI